MCYLCRGAASTCNVRALQALSNLPQAESLQDQTLGQRPKKFPPKKFLPKANFPKKFPAKKLQAEGLQDNTLGHRPKKSLRLKA